MYSFSSICQLSYIFSLTIRKLGIFIAFSFQLFDFVFQKKGGETEEFDKNIPQTKPKKNQKYNQKYNQNQKRGNQGNKNYNQVSLQRFNVTQSIQPESTWTLLKDFNNVCLYYHIWKFLSKFAFSL